MGNNFFFFFKVIAPKNLELLSTCHIFAAFKECLKTFDDYDDCYFLHATQFNTLGLGFCVETYMYPCTPYTARAVIKLLVLTEGRRAVSFFLFYGRFCFSAPPPPARSSVSNWGWGRVITISQQNGGLIFTIFCLANIILTLGYA